MKYLSVCSGIEAATVAWHGFGWTPVAFSEIEPFPSAVLGHHYPAVPNLGDMTKFAEWPEEILVECDILVGGPPCQAFSVAGLRRSLDDDRGNITISYVRLLDHIDAIRRKHGRAPAIAVYENVPGLLSTKDNAFGCLIGALTGCDEAPETETGKWPKAGFFCGEARRVGYRVLDAQYFGVAQLRRRIFLVAVPCEVVASLGEPACPSEILSLRESVLGNPPSRGAAWEVSPTVPSRSTAGGGLGTDFDCDGGLILGPKVGGINADCSNGCGAGRAGESQGQDDVVLASPAVANPLTQRMHKGINTTVDEGQTPIVMQAVEAVGDVVWIASDQANAERCVNLSGTLNCNLGQRGGWIAANGECLTGHRTHALTTRAAVEEDGIGRGTPIIAFHPTKDPISSTDGTMHAMWTGSKNGCASAAMAFKPSHYTRGKDGSPSDVVAPLSADEDKGDQDTVVAFTQNSRDEVRLIGGDGEAAGALAAESGMHQTNYIAAPTMHVRRLTPKECERLQGFPDNYTLITFRKKPASDGPRYRALGNSMAVPCMWWIGDRIRQAACAATPGRSHSG